ncbi:hypothetical protein Pcinc_030647 [Petrolisthes cinctipes]|uniref:RING-type E3 ubiquitin transferase n=1 Tax=Petrolisthes cinctipes TaxID=88211 RepID=A0AAE1K616_PETCI|nr:hypothetical protein Pcinc_030647 [Petrolisthes cinctipes]
MPVREYVSDLVGLGVTAGLTFTFYHFVKAGKEVVQHLKDVPELDIDVNLVERVRQEGGGAAMGAAAAAAAVAAEGCGCEPGLDACVKGTVKALGPAIQSLEYPDVTGVMRRYTIQEHLMSQVMGFWMNDRLTIDSTTTNVPFMLLRKGVGVQISEPKKLEDVDMTVVSEKFNATNNSLLDHLWGFMKGVRTTGTQQTEEMLVEGTAVMGIGRLVLRDEGLHLDPNQSIPYLLTTRNKKSVIENLETPLPYLRILAGLTACGVIFYAYRLVSRWVSKWKRDRQRREETRLLEEARAQWRRREGGSAETEGGDGGGGWDLPENMMCVVCMGPRDVLLLPCRHICVCGECALRLDPRACPVCRTHIDTIQPVFFS